MRSIVIVGVATFLCACATPPERIKAAQMPTGAYSALDCSQLDAEIAQVDAKIATASEAQQQAVTGDTIGVFLIGVPVSSLAGADRETEIAVLKGQSEAIGLERVRKRCFA